MRRKNAIEDRSTPAPAHRAWVNVDISDAPKVVQEDRKFHMQNFANTIASFALKTKRSTGEKIPPRLLELGRVMCEGEWYIFVAEMWANEVPGGNVQVKRLVKNPPDGGEEDDVLEYDEIDQALAAFMKS